LVAGFVHEQLPLEVLEVLLGTIGQARCAQVDTAAANLVRRRAVPENQGIEAT